MIQFKITASTVIFFQIDVDTGDTKDVLAELNLQLRRRLMRKRVILVKVEYKNQSWFVTQEETMGQTHAFILQEGSSYPRLALTRQISKTDSLRIEGYSG